MNLYLTVCRRERRTSKYFQWNSSSLKVSVHLIKFRCCISNNALPHQLVTMQGIVLKIWNICGYWNWFYKRFYIPTTFLFFRKSERYENGTAQKLDIHLCRTFMEMKNSTQRPKKRLFQCLLMGKLIRLILYNDYFFKRVLNVFFPDEGQLFMTI